MRRQDRPVLYPWGSQAWRDEYARLRRIFMDDAFARQCLRSSNNAWRYVALRGEICGAKTRKGTPCQAKPILTSTRCRNHGGLSTGPTTAEGKARSKANLLLRWKR